jgi:hypothetical protein
MNVATSKRAGKSSAWRKSVVCGNNSTHQYVSSKKTICGKELIVSVNDLALYKCNKTKLLHVAVKCPICGQLIEVCEIGDLSFHLQKKVRVRKLNVDDCKNY